MAIADGGEMDRARVAAFVRGWGPALLAAIVSLSVLAPLLRNPIVIRLEPIASVALMALACFGWMARSDRKAFASLFVPASIIATGSLLVPLPAGYVIGMLPWLGLVLFLFMAPARRWWWRSVLRRRATPLQRFAYAVQVEAYAWTRALARDAADVPPTASQLAAADAAVFRMEALMAPGEEAGAIRDAGVATARRWIAYARRHDPDEDSSELTAELARNNQDLARLRAGG
jgi:hypothetical protein